MIRHVVMIKFKKDAKQEDIDTFIREVKKLPHLNKEIRDYSHGPCVKTRFHSGDFDFANCCDIDSYEAMERYMSHWAHLRMTPFLPDVLENMLSFDWEIDYQGPPFDEKAAAEEAEKEKARVVKPHPDPAKAWVPEIRGQTRFEREHNREHHDHFICRVCGRILEFSNPEIERLQEENAAALGFLIEGHRHQIFGLCRSCQSRPASESRR